LDCGKIDTINHKDFEVQDRRGRWYRLEIRPYKTSEKKIDGAVIVLIDLNYIKRSLSDVAKYFLNASMLSIENTAEQNILLAIEDLTKKL
jgi:PAS domain